MNRLQSRSWDAFRVAAVLPAVDGALGLSGSGAAATALLPPAAAPSAHTPAEKGNARPCHTAVYDCLSVATRVRSVHGVPSPWRPPVYVCRPEVASAPLSAGSQPCTPWLISTFRRQCLRRQCLSRASPCFPSPPLSFVPSTGPC